MSSPFELFLFAREPARAREAVAAGVRGLIVDWEHAGKAVRQAGADTEINHQTIADLELARATVAAPILCRLNPSGEQTAAELEAAIAAGADEVLLPMVRSVAEVERVLALAAHRCQVGILVETTAAVELAPRLGRLSLSRVYVGLNDLALERGSSSIFAAVADGTVERVRQRFTMPFGFGGLTLPEAGGPIPCRLLLAEMVRLDCTWTFLRRSFLRDVGPGPFAPAVASIELALAAARLRGGSAVAADHRELLGAIAALARSR